MPDQPQQPPQQYPGPQPPYYYPQEDEINLIELWNVLLAHKKLIIAITTLSTAIALAVALLMTPIYRAETLLAPAQKEKGGGLSAMASQFGGLASLAGINVGGGDSSTDEAIALLKSREFTTKFIQEENLMPILFEKDWDATKKQWINEEDPPTVWDAYEVFNEIRMVNTEKDTGLVTLAIEWKNPELAADWVNKLVKRINTQQRNEAILKAQKSIQYLNEELAKTSVIEVKQSIYSLIEAQTKNKMLANTQDEYAFRVLDQAVAPEEKVKPKRKLIVVLGFILGGMLGIFLVFFLQFIKNQREKPNPVQ